MSDIKMHVVARGLTQLKKELTSVAPDLKNELLKVYRNYAKDVASDARARIPQEKPMRGWRTTPPKTPRNGKGGWIPWDPARAQAGIVYKAGVRDTTSGRKLLFGYRVLNASPQGAIMEIAGTKSSGKQGASNNPNAGNQFIRNLSWYGTPGRFIWKAYDKMQTEILSGTARETQRIAEAYEARINSLGDGKA